MTFGFQEILIVLLFIALVARELLPMVLARFGIIKNGKKPELENIEQKLKLVANEHYHEMKDEFGKINETLKRIEDNLTRNFTISHEGMAKNRETMATILAKLNGR